MYTTYFIYGVLALSKQCECVSTKITSITEDFLSQNRRIASILLSALWIVVHNVHEACALGVLLVVARIFTFSP